MAEDIRRSVLDYKVDIVCEGDDLAKWSTIIDVDKESSRLKNVFNCVVERVVKIFDVASNGKSLSVCVMLSNNDTVKEYNNQFRGKNAATNVLSFPMWGFNLTNGDRDLPDGNDLCDDLDDELRGGLRGELGDEFGDGGVEFGEDGGDFDFDEDLEGDLESDLEGGRVASGEDEGDVGAGAGVGVSDVACVVGDGDDGDDGGVDYYDLHDDCYDGFVHIGDVIFAYETVVDEAGEFDKNAVNHVTHLFVHSVLHLFGLDHMEEDERLAMEQIEIDVLKELDIDNPYET